MTHASVFSGIGGAEVAAAMLGWDNLFHCEINPFGRAILNYWFENSISYEDITKEDFTRWGGQVDVLTGGFPCQPFSLAGRRRGAEDDRYLWPYMLKCINQVRPTWFIGENVGGITSMVLPGKDVKMGNQNTLFGEGDGIVRREQRFVIEEICKNVESAGYSVQPIIIPACAVGAPHRRDRVFIIGHRNITDTKGEQAGEQLQFGASEYSKSQIPKLGEYNRKDGAEGDIPDTKGKQGERLGYKQSKISDKGQEQLRRGDFKNSNIAGCGRWDAFPSFSPIHRGNDGIPFPLDDLSIPADEWRTESLKAYGNAIVPQVMYEIFRAIELVENRKN